MTKKKLNILGRLKTYFVSGLLVTAPIGITIYVAWIIISYFDNKIRPLIPEQYLPDYYLPFDIPGIGLLVCFIAMSLVGWLTRNFVGTFLIKLSENTLSKMPVVRGIYSSIKQILKAILEKDGTSFRQVGLVEFPRKGFWTICFVTEKTKGEVREVLNEELINIYVPTTPNPTSGYMLFVKPEDLKILDMSVEEGLKMVVSTGIVTPPWPKKK